MSATVSKNIFWMSLSRAAALVLLFLAYQKLFRYLGPFGTGQYQFIQSYVLIFTPIIDFGIQQFITKKISEEPHRAKELFQKYLAFEVAIAAAVFALMFGIAWARNFDPVILAGVAIAGAGLAVNALTYPFLAVMTTFQDLRKVALINFINSLVNVSVIFLAVYLKRYVVFLSSVTLVFGLVDLAIYRYYIKKHIPKPEVLKSAKAFDSGLVKSIFKAAWPFVLLVGFSAIYNRVDILIITNLMGYQETGYYSAAYKFFDLLAFFPATVSHVLLPFFSGLVSQGLMVQVRSTLEKYLKYMLGIALPMAVGGTVLAKPLVALVNGPEFVSRSPEILSILVWAIAILFIYIPANSLIITQLTKKAALITGVNVLVNIMGNILLIPIYGIKAAALMTVVSEGLQGVFYFYFVKKNITSFRFVSILVKPAIASAIMGLALWQVRSFNLAISLPVGTGVYACMLLITRFITKDDLAFLKTLFSAAEEQPALSGDPALGKNP